ncbi:hypothetical protein CPB86DRAFT_704141 [Serendipita vermifera]|nr:hypothetical protein CPB86DRAFT_704141 [Serendipita vermifera]
MSRAAQSRATAGRPGSDGVFYLGIRPGDQELPKGYKQWKELGVGGKVARSGARATSSVVILAGAALTALLVYALATELGSSNSPTVIYADVCEMIKEDERVNVDEVKWTQLAWWDVREWQWSTSAAQAWFSRTKHELQTRGRDLFALLTGQPLKEKSERPAQVPETRPAHTSSDSSRADLDIRSPSSSNASQRGGSGIAQSLWSSFTGLFAWIRPTSIALSAAQARRNEKLVYTSGEVHVDLIRDTSNNYIYRYILVDLPNSTKSASRIFVKRLAGVDEHEGVMRFS